MAHDSIPPADPEFHNWVVPFSAYVTANAAAMGVDPADATTLTAAVGVWTTAYPAHKTATGSAVAARTVKDQSRSNLEDIARPLIQQLQASPKVTDAQRNNMKINVHSTTRTPASVPTTAPMATVDTSRRLQHVISYRDSTSPNSKKKPAGVANCEIWAKVGGPAPTDASQLTYLGNASKTPQIEEFTGAQAGLTVWYWLCWVNTRGDKGPWSEPISATIAG
jgi:hypothetical protein